MTVGEPPLAVLPRADTHRQLPGSIARLGDPHLTLMFALAALLALAPWLVQLPVLEQVLAGLTVAISAAGFARSTHPVRPVSMIAFGFVFSWIGIAAIYQLSHGVAAWGDNAVTRSVHVPEALSLNLLAVAAMYAGFFVWQPNQARAQVRVPRNYLPRTPGRVLPILYLLAAIALTPFAVAASGGLGALFSSRSERGQALQLASSLQFSGGVGVALATILPVALSVASSYLMILRLIDQGRSRGWRRVSTTDALLLLPALALVVLFANPFANTRAIAVTAFGSLVLLCVRTRGRGTGWSLAAIVLLATLVAYPLANVFRDDNTDRAGGLAVFGTEDFDGFQQVVNSIYFVEDAGHSWGHYTSSAFLYFVPRSIWTDKATPASIDVALDRHYSFVNLSLPLHAEFFIEFGIVGMVVVLLLATRMGGWLDRAWSRGESSLAARLAPYVAVATLMMIRGPLGSLAPIYATTTGLIVVGLLAAQRAGPRRPRVASPA